VFAQNRGVTNSTLAVRAARLSRAEIWVDNWFAMSVDGAPLYEDSTATTPSGRLTGERITFNTRLADDRRIRIPRFHGKMILGWNIGERNQQMGDGGAIAQFKDANSDVWV
jgi:hypothetical protein